MVVVEGGVSRKPEVAVAVVCGVWGVELVRSFFNVETSSKQAGRFVSRDFVRMRLFFEPVFFVDDNCLDRESTTLAHQQGRSWLTSSS